MTPPALDRVVKRCMAKDPDERWQTRRRSGSGIEMDRGGRLADRFAGGTPRGARSHTTRVGHRSRWTGLPGRCCDRRSRSLDFETHAAEARHSHGHNILPPGDRLARPRCGPPLALSPDGKHTCLRRHHEAYQSTFMCGRWIVLRPDRSRAPREPATLSSLPTASGSVSSPAAKLKKVPLTGERR